VAAQCGKCRGHLAFPQGPACGVGELDFFAGVRFDPALELCDCSFLFGVGKVVVML